MKFHEFDLKAAKRKKQLKEYMNELKENKFVPAFSYRFQDNVVDGEVHIVVGYESHPDKLFKLVSNLDLEHSDNEFFHLFTNILVKMVQNYEEIIDE